MILFVGFVVTCLVIIYAYFRNEYRKYVTNIENIPGPPTRPIVGNAFELSDTTAILPNVMKWIKEYGPFFKIMIGSLSPTIIFCDAKGVQYGLSHSKNITKTTDYKFLERWLGTGLLTSTGEKWRTRRKLLTPAFHFKILEDFIEVFNNASDVLVEKLEKEVGKDSFDVYPYITLCTLDVICETAMGTKVNAQENIESEYVKSVKEMCRILIERAFSAFKQHDALYMLSRDYYKEKRALKVLHGYTGSVIRKKRQENLENGFQNGGSVHAGQKKKRLAFLDLLMGESQTEGKALTDLDLREEVDTFMFEGHDTTTSAISFVLYCLADNPKAQKAAVEELNDILAGDTRNANYKDLQDMKYLEMVIKEGLRLYPSVPFFGREVTEHMEYNGTVLPKGASVGFFIYGLHRDPEVFPDPEKFLPERFDSNDIESRSPFAYVPFSAGLRNCIGQKFAMLEMKSTLSKILRNYEILPSVPRHEVLLAAETILKPANGVRIRLKKRL